MSVNRYYALSIPGLEKVAWREIQTRLRDVELFGEDQGRLLFSYPGDPRELLFLRSVESLYVFIRNIKGISRSRKSLGDVFRIVRSADLETASRLHKQAHRSKGKKKLTFKVTSSMLGRHNFRRADLQKAVESAIIARHGWTMDRLNPMLEVRIDLEEEEALLGLRITDESMRQRSYKVVHLPASLKPTVAYCMALLSEPSPADVFVDPMCGAGTIVIERAMAGAYSRILGGDVEETVVKAARDNADASRKSIDLALWDVSAVPLQDDSVDKVVCNLPFGKQSGSRSGNRALYSHFFRETARILKPGGMAVLLTTETELMRELTRQYRAMHLRRYLKIDLLGLRACIYIIDRMHF
jgi:tRNA (guanine6-N2)-methyltransferase